MSAILWLASYPKSGNTWLRAVIANYLANQPEPIDINTLPDFAYGDMRSNYYGQISGLPADSLPFERINALRPQVHRFLAAARPGLVFVKTHTVLIALNGIPTITPEVTAGAIYVVRNPLDTAVSFADHYGLTIEEGVRALCFQGLQLEPKPGHILQPIADWSTHVESWRRSKELRVRILRYEDMLAAPQQAFGKAMSFLGLAKDKDRLDRAIRNSSFGVLAEQERTAGFVERSRNAARFFRRGTSGGWRNDLSPAQVQALIERHRSTMTDLGYLDASGTLLV